MMYLIPGRIKYSEVGEDGLLTLHQLINYFQDCSTFHLEDLNLGIEYSASQNLACYMLAWQIEINRMPKIGERIKVGTLIHEGKGIFCYRNYALYDEQDQVLAYGNVTVCFVDTKTEKFIKLSPEEIAKYPHEEKFDMEYLPRKIKTPKFEVEYPTTTVNKSHIDMNHHVNNSQYAAIAMNYIPQDLEYKRVRVEYKKAAKLGDEMIPMTVEQDGTFYLSLCDEERAPYVVFAFSS